MATPRLRNTENMKIKMMEVFEMLKEKLKKAHFARGSYYNKRTECRCAVGYLVPIKHARNMPDIIIERADVLKYFRKHAKKKYADLPKGFLIRLQTWNDEGWCDESAVENFIETYEFKENNECYEFLKQ